MARRTFDETLDLLERIFADEGTINIPQRETRTIDGEVINIGAWIHARRVEYRRGVLSAYRTAALEGLGIDWGASPDHGEWLMSKIEYDGQVPETEEEKVAILCDLLRRGVRVTQRTTVMFGTQSWTAGRYLDHLRRRHRDGQVDPSVVSEIERAGGSLDQAPTRFDANLERLRQAISVTGRNQFASKESVDLPEGKWHVGNFIMQVRSLRRRGELSMRRYKALLSTGVDLSPLIPTKKSA